MCGALVWVLALVAASPAIGSGVPSLSRAGAVVYGAGAIVCHQRPERSFTSAGRPLPVCARCTGLYVSALVSGAVALLFASRPIAPVKARWLLAAAAAPTAITWAGELVGVMHPSNAARAIAAIPLGAAAAWIVVAAVRRATHAV